MIYHSSKLKLDQLKTQGMKVGGKKSELVSRLENDDLCQSASMSSLSDTSFKCELTFSMFKGPCCVSKFSGLLGEFWYQPHENMNQASCSIQNRSIR